MEVKFENKLYHYIKVTKNIFSSINYLKNKLLNVSILKLTRKLMIRL